MEIRNLILKNRSYRRFDENFKVDCEALREFVELARFSASAANLQPLRFILSCDKEKNNRIFPHLRWAGYLKDWPGPKEGERPSAYIIILGDRELMGDFTGYDCGIAAQSILLGAVEKDLGGCMIAAINKEGLRKALNIPEKYEILLVIALGRPVEKVVIDDIKNGDVKYWRDEQDVHHVPKRTLDELILDI
jgi:nitroreductase